MLRLLSAGERERSIKVASTAGRPWIIIRSSSTERTTWFFSDVIAQVGLNRGNKRSLIRILYMTARFGCEVVRTAFGLFAKLDVTGTSGALGEALVLVEEQIRHVDIGRVSRVHHRRRCAAVGAASRIVVVIIIINIRGDTGGGTSGANGGGGDGGADVSRPWRWCWGLSKLSWPQSRTIGTGIGTTGRPDATWTRSRR